MGINIIYLYVGFKNLINFSHPSKGLGEGHLNPKPSELWLHQDQKLLQCCLPETVDSSRVLVLPCLFFQSELSRAARGIQGLLWGQPGSSSALGAGPAAGLQQGKYSKMLSDSFPARVAFYWGALGTRAGVEVELVTWWSPAHTRGGNSESVVLTHVCWSLSAVCTRSGVLSSVSLSDWQLLVSGWKLWTSDFRLFNLLLFM